MRMTTPAQPFSAASSQTAAVSTIVTHGASNLGGRSTECLPGKHSVQGQGQALPRVAPTTTCNTTTTTTVEDRRRVDDDPFSYLRQDASLSALYSSGSSPKPNPEFNQLTSTGSSKTTSVKRASSPRPSTATLRASGRAPRLRLHTRSCSFTHDAHNCYDASPAFCSSACSGHSPSGTARSIPTPQPSPSSAAVTSLDYNALAAANDSRPQRTARRGKCWPCAIAARLCAKLRSIQPAKGRSSSSCPTSPALPSPYALYKQRLRQGSRHHSGAPSSSCCLTSPRDVWEAAECDLLEQWSADSPHTAGRTDSPNAHNDATAAAAAAAAGAAAAATAAGWNSEATHAANPALSATADHAVWEAASGVVEEEASCCGGSSSSSSSSRGSGSGSGGSSPSALQTLLPAGMASRPVWLANLATRLSPTH